MIIKTLCICVLSLIWINTSFATAQGPDYIIIDNLAMDLYTHPLEIYFSQNPHQRPKGGIRSTNWIRGYVATFEIRNGNLWLNKIEVNKKTGKVDVINSVFPNINDRKLTWYSKKLILHSGKYIEFVPKNYGYTYEKYRIVQIVSGSVISDLKLTGAEYMKMLWQGYFKDLAS